MKTIETILRGEEIRQSPELHEQRNVESISETVHPTF